MKKICKSYCSLISDITTFFYPPFRKFMTLQFFRYGLTGGMNLVFDWIMYFLIYNFILQHRMLEFGFVTISSHIAALGIKHPIVLFSGFIMQKYVTFSSSNISGRVQLFRYMVVSIINLAITYVGLKILVEHLSFYPTPSIMIISILTIGISYFSQKYFTFKITSYL